MTAFERSIAGMVLGAAILGALALFKVAPAEPAFAAGRACESLTQLTLEKGAITLAETVPAGTFVPPGNGGQGAAAASRAYKMLPSFCRVQATLKPTSDSDIKIETWMPIDGWNGKFQGVGNGGLAGVISYSALAAAVGGGYSSASTDTGHVGGSATFATGHPERIIDFGYRSLHEMTVQSKVIVNAFYGTGAKVSFWNGCSQGGRQGVNEAMRYPDDYHGIIAGAPSVGQALLHAVRLSLNRNAIGARRAAFLRRIPGGHEAAMQACDAADGRRMASSRTPCDAGSIRKCWSAKARMRHVPHGGPGRNRAHDLWPVTDAKSGARIFCPAALAGLRARVGDAGWPATVHDSSRRFEVSRVQGSDLGCQSIRSGDRRRQSRQMDKGVIGLSDPDLTPFFGRGGKLLMYQGLGRPADAGDEHRHVLQQRRKESRSAGRG